MQFTISTDGDHRDSREWNSYDIEGYWVKGKSAEGGEVNGEGSACWIEDDVYGEGDAVLVEEVEAIEDGVGLA